MAKYKIVIGRSAERALQKLPSDATAKILKAIIALGEEPFPPGARKLSGWETAYRIRVGNYRVIYECHGAQLIIAVVKIGHRKDIYR